MKISLESIKKAQKNQKEYNEGRYQVRIVKAQNGKAETGTKYLEVEFETIGENVFKVRKRYYLSEKALSVLLNLLAAVGIYDKNSDKDIEYDKDDLLGAILSIELVKGEANSEGKKFLEVKPWSCEAVSGLASPKSKKEDIIDDEEVPF